MSLSDSGMVSVNRDDLALVLDGSQPKDTLRVHQYVHLAAMRLRAVLDAPSEPEGPPSPTPSLPDPEGKVVDLMAALERSVKEARIRPEEPR